MINLADENYRLRSQLPTKSSSSSPASWADRIEPFTATSGSYELEWRLARGLFVDGELRPELYARAARHGRRAIELNGDRVEGYFWTGVNLALHAQTRKGLKGILALLESRRTLQRACKISEDYHGAGPLRVLGRLDHKSPRVLGGNLQRSQSYYERALMIAPTNTVTLIYAAELEIDRRNPRKALTLLERVLSLPIDPDWEFENIRDKTLAKSMLERLSTL